MKHALPQLSLDHIDFPPIESALEQPNGLLAFGGDLSPERLLNAYQNGIFPWFDENQPILWWSPNPRAVLFPEQFKPSRSLSKSIRNRGYRVTLNQEFASVITHCQQTPRQMQHGTWITDEMKTAYIRLHELGYAHSVECWLDEQLIGGLYGISLGRLFFGESMFSIQVDASKVAFAVLVQHLKSANFPLIDCQVSNSHMQSLGATEIPRDEFQQYLQNYLHYIWKSDENPWSPKQKFLL